MSAAARGEGAAAQEHSAGRDHVLLAVNGTVHEIRGAAAFGTLSDFLRHDLRLTGTKIVCAEGDCGACSVLLGRLDDARPGSGFTYRSIDSCIAFVYQLDGCHVVTVDALASTPQTQDLSDLHPVQRAMAESYGSQCGFCTPGFVMTISDLVEQARAAGRELDDDTVLTGLGGNLCRCTGYVQILEGVRSLDPREVPAPGARFDEASLAEQLAPRREATIEIAHGGHTVSIPAGREELLALRDARPSARVVAGATDLGVRHNKGQLEAGDRLVLPRSLPEFRDVVYEQETGTLRLGAAATWNEVLAASAELVPELVAVLERFGGTQIRNLGTVGGNVVNASPIADSVPFFFATDAQLTLVSVRGERTVPISEFYRGYKTFDLEPDELLQDVRLGLPDAAAGERLVLLKAARRHDLDISTFTAALWLRISGAQGQAGTVEAARLAYGGVGPVVLRLPGAERALVGEAFSRQTFEQAGEVAAEEISPISDVRGAATYRRLLARNVLLRFWQRLASPGKGVAA